MPDGAPPPHSESEFEWLSELDCVDLQDAVWELVRWLHTNHCGSPAGRLEQVMRAVPPLTEPPNPDPEPEMLALKPVNDVLDEIMILPPRGLAPTQYKAMRRLRDRAKECIRHRLRKLAGDKADRDRAIVSVTARMHEFPQELQVESLPEP